MTRDKYYTLENIEFEGEFDSTRPNKQERVHSYGTEVIVLISPEQAKEEIAARGQYVKENYRDGGSFDIYSGKYTYEFRIAGRDYLTKDGFLKYKPFVKKVYWIEK